ncbi:MAG: glycosyltransferase family 2 protein [Tepidisphaeraceae bacterium]
MLPRAEQLESKGQFCCTLILPTYNAADFIEFTVERLTGFLRRHDDWCALFVCDGCTDGTVEMLYRLVGRADPRIRVISCGTNRGKGSVVRHGLNASDTPYLVYTDVDFAYDPEEAIKIVKVLEEGADITVANRVSAQSEFLINPRDFPSIYWRHLMSRSFNWWLRRMLPITALDTQAGLKGMTARAWQILAPTMSNDGFFFDVELLARAAAAQLRIEETAVCFKYVDLTTVRMVSHGWQMIKDTVRLRHRMRKTAKGSRIMAGTPVQRVVETVGKPGVAFPVAGKARLNWRREFFPNPKSPRPDIHEESGRITDAQ